MPLAEDWGAFMDTGPGGFASAGTWRVRGSAPVEVRGIYTARHAAAAGGDWPGVATAAPAFTVPASDLPAGAGQGDAVTIDGRAWRAADLQPDGTGLVRVILEGA